MGQPTRLHPTALVVEDDADQRFLVAALLEETGFAVVECESAEAAMAVLENVGDRVSMIFSDIRLPGTLDGVDLAQVVQDRFPEITMIVTSGSPGDRLDHLPHEATYMAKPWLAINILTAAERSLLQHGHA